MNGVTYENSSGPGFNPDHYYKKEKKIVSNNNILFEDG
jgi:hypothetical protein